MTPSVWRIGRASEDSRGNCFEAANGFRIFPFYVSECCWWKLLVRCKTLIYCGQLCNNAVNYPNTPLMSSPWFPLKADLPTLFVRFETIIKRYASSIREKFWNKFQGYHIAPLDMGAPPVIRQSTPGLLCRRAPMKFLFGVQCINFCFKPHE
jgi:hypothetical protein